MGNTVLDSTRSGPTIIEHGVNKLNSTHTVIAYCIVKNVTKTTVLQFRVNDAIDKIATMFEMVFYFIPK